MQIQPRNFVLRRQHHAQLQLCVPQVGVKAYGYQRVKTDLLTELLDVAAAQAM
jgi:hypothetical protein